MLRIKVQVLMTLKLLFKLESQSNNKNELASLEFPTPALKFKPKKLPLGMILLQNLPSITKMSKFTEWKEIIGEGVALLRPPLSLFIPLSSK